MTERQWRRTVAAEVDDLDAEIERLRGEVEHYDQLASRALAQVDELRRENERLRASITG